MIGTKRFYSSALSYLAVLSGCSLLGCSSGGEQGSEPKPEDSPHSEVTQRPDAREIPLPEFPVGTCRVYGGDPASWVLVDGVPARSSSGARLSPPCEVTAMRGSRTITLTRPGYQDAQREIALSQQAEVEFPPLQEATESSVSTATTALFEWPVRKPFPLAQVNSPGAELDPYLSNDGLSLWFAGDRADGKAIYTSTRPSLWHDFSPPEVLILSRGPELPASPSVTGDGLTIYYSQPHSQCIWSLLRNGPFEPFSDKRRAIVDTQSTGLWQAAQVLPDDLRLYWTSVEDDEVTGYAVVRKSTEAQISKPIEYPLPGLIPMLSSDGLRQYQYDGETLTRSRRASIADPFSQPELLQELKIPGYEVQPHRRQFFVTEDEQWMIYSTGDESTADLYLVRLAETPQWGVPPTGKPIPPKPPKVAEMERPEEKGSPNDDPAPEVDPRSLPLAFSEYHMAWLQYLADRDYEKALELTNSALKDDDFAGSRDVLQTDLATLQSLQQFWTFAESALKDSGKVKTVALGAARADVVAYEDGQLTLKVGKQEVTRELKKLPALTLAGIVQASVEPDDKQAYASMGYFLYYDADGSPSTAFNRLIPFPELSDALLDRVTSHPLHLAELEFNRGNYSAGMVSLRKILENWPDSKAGRQAREMRQSLYQKIDWRVVGSREWAIDKTQGLYRAESGRVENSYLQSPRSYRNFELQFEFQTEGKLGQGGVYFHYPGQGRVFNQAYKIPLAGDRGVAPDMYCTGALFGLEAPTENAVKPVGEWNTARLIVRGSSILFILNGKTVLETFALSDEIPEEGYVLLDGVTGGITYRKVLLTEMP